jgi:hypothetical protein
MNSNSRLSPIVLLIVLLMLPRASLQASPRTAPSRVRPPD